MGFAIKFNFTTDRGSVCDKYKERIKNDKCVLDNIGKTLTKVSLPSVPTL